MTRNAINQAVNYTAMPRLSAHVLERRAKLRRQYRAWRQIDDRRRNDGILECQRAHCKPVEAHILLALAQKAQARACGDEDKMLALTDNLTRLYTLAASVAANAVACMGYKDKMAINDAVDSVCAELGGWSMTFAPEVDNNVRTFAQDAIRQIRLVATSAVSLHDVREYIGEVLSQYVLLHTTMADYCATTAHISVDGAIEHYEHQIDSNITAGAAHLGLLVSPNTARRLGMYPRRSCLPSGVALVDIDGYRSYPVWQAMLVLVDTLADGGARAEVRRMGATGAKLDAINGALYDAPTVDWHDGASQAACDARDSWLELCGHTRIWADSISPATMRQAMGLRACADCGWVDAARHMYYLGARDVTAKQAREAEHLCALCWDTNVEYCAQCDRAERREHMHMHGDDWLCHACECDNYWHGADAQ